MYHNIGLRNHQAIQRNGYKLLETWKDHPELSNFYISYKSALDRMEILFKAANMIVND